jgi:hypothetical protein
MKLVFVLVIFLAYTIQVATDSNKTAKAVEQPSPPPPSTTTGNTSLYFRNAPDPKILLPTKTTIWKSGQLEVIKWNASYRLPNNLYYNERTRVKVQMYKKNQRKHELLFTIADNLPFSYGQISWIVPNTSAASAFVVVYPSFFDWPESCLNCLQEVSRSDYFQVLPCFDGDSKCSNSPTTVLLNPPSDYIGSTACYWTLVRNVVIGIFAFFLVGFLIAYFVYTKQGRKTFNFYRRKRIGMLYNYQPQSSESNATSKTKVSPLSDFLHESSSISTNGDTEDAISRHQFNQLTEPIYEIDEPGTPARTSTPKSPTPPTPAKTPAPRNSVASSRSTIILPQHEKLPMLSTVSPSVDSILTPQPTIVAAFPSDKPAIDYSDAMLISNAFRTTLISDNVSTPQQQSSPSDSGSPILNRLGWLQDKL